MLKMDKHELLSCVNNSKKINALYEDMDVTSHTSVSLHGLFTDHTLYGKQINVINPELKTHFHNSPILYGFSKLTK